MSLLHELYDAHAPAVFAFALHQLRDEAAAKDVLQAVFVRMARVEESLPRPEHHRSHLLKLTHWLILDLLKKKRHTGEREHRWLSERMPLFTPSADPDAMLMDDALCTAMLALPEDQRAVVHLHLWEGFTFDRIAEILGIPRNTAASRYRLALDKLRPQLQTLYDEIR